MCRKNLILYQQRLLDAADQALDRMRQSPDIPVNLADTPVGSFPILRAMGVEIIPDGNDVFAFMRDFDKSEEPQYGTD